MIGTSLGPYKIIEQRWLALMIIVLVSTLVLAFVSPALAQDRDLGIVPD